MKRVLAFISKFKLPKVLRLYHLRGVKGKLQGRTLNNRVQGRTLYTVIRYKLRLAAGLATENLKLSGFGKTLKALRYNLRLSAGVALGLLLVLSPIVWLYTTKARETEAAWFNDNWLYRKAIAVTNGSGLTL